MLASQCTTDCLALAPGKVNGLLATIAWIALNVLHGGAAGIALIGMRTADANSASV